MRRQMRMVAWMQLGFPFMVIYKDLRSLRVNWLVFLLRQWSMKKINEIRQKNQQEERLAAVVWTVEFSFLKEWLQPILYIYTSWRLWDIGETRLRLGLRLSPGSDGCGTSLTSFSSSPLTVHFPCIAGNKNDNDHTNFQVTNKVSSQFSLKVVSYRKKSDSIYHVIMIRDFICSLR